MHAQICEDMIGVFGFVALMKTFAKPIVIPAYAGIHTEHATWETHNLHLLLPFR